MENLKHAGLMLAAGIGIPVLASLNGRLGVRLGSPTAAAAVLFAVALTCALVAVWLAGSGGTLARAASQPAQLYLGGVLVAFYVLSITHIAPVFGLGNAILFVLFGQMISAAVIDHFGLFAAIRQPLGLPRAAGLALMAAGVFLARPA
jgi:transporter family-2 protein